MQLETSRFGPIEVDPENIITLTQPILGFQEYRRFVLLPGPSECLKWLQSTDSGELAFILLDPRALLPDYRVDLGATELAELAANGAADLEVYTLVVVPADPQQTRTNLKAPILINPKRHLGKQTILDHSTYPVRYYLAPHQRDVQEDPEEAPNACSNT